MIALCRQARNVRTLLTNFKVILYFLKIVLLCLLRLHRKVIAFAESLILWLQASILSPQKIFFFYYDLTVDTITYCSDSPLK